MLTLIAQNTGLDFITTAKDILPGASDVIATAPERGFGIFVGGLISASMVIGALLLLLYLIWGAIDWITAGGDSGKIQKARDKISQAVIGIIVLASSIALFVMIQRFLGISVLNFGGSSNNGGGGGSGGGSTSCNESRRNAVVTSSSNSYGYCTSGGVKLKCVPPGAVGPQYNYYTWNPCECLNGVSAQNNNYTFVNCTANL